MAGVVALAGDTIADLDPFDTTADLQHTSHIAVPRDAWECRFASRLAAVFPVVDLGTDRDGSVLILDQYAVVRNCTEVKFLDFDLADGR